MDNRLKYWGQWVIVLPFSIIGAFLVDFPIHWILYATLSGGSDPIITPYPEFPERAIAPFFRAIVFVYISGFIAPDCKFITSKVFFIIWTLGAVVSYIFASSGLQIENIEISLLAGGLPIVLGVVGGAVGLILVRKKLIY